MSTDNTQQCTNQAPPQAGHTGAQVCCADTGTGIFSLSAPTAEERRKMFEGVIQQMALPPRPTLHQKRKAPEPPMVSFNYSETSVQQLPWSPQTRSLYRGGVLAPVLTAQHEPVPKCASLIKKQCSTRLALQFQHDRRAQPDTCYHVLIRSLCATSSEASFAKVAKHAQQHDGYKRGHQALEGLQQST